MEKIFVTQAGYDQLLKKKEELVSQLRASQFDKGRAAAGDSNSWHDNAEFDMHARSEMMLANQVSEVMYQIEASLIVELPNGNDVLQIGHVVILKSEDDRIHEYMLVGFGETDLSSVPKKLSYDSPIMMHFVGKSVGHSVSIMIKGSAMRFTLEEIKLG